MDRHEQVGNDGGCFSNNRTEEAAAAASAIINSMHHIKVVVAIMHVDTSEPHRLLLYSFKFSQNYV
jgi:hypothetical protein